MKLKIAENKKISFGKQSGSCRRYQNGDYVNAGKNDSISPLSGASDSAVIGFLSSCSGGGLHCGYFPDEEV